MTTPSLPYAPIRDDYSFVPGNGVVSSRLDGGRSRQRLDVIGSSHTVEMQWLLRGLEYTAQMAFFRDTLAEGSLPFLADLLTNVRVLTTHKCRCAGGAMPRLIANKGDAYWVKGTIEVEPNPTYYGSMQFAITLPFFPPLVDASPHVFTEYILGDSFRIIDAVPPADPLKNFDGVYVVTTPIAPSQLTAAGGTLVNPNWNLINPGNRVAVCTITRVPT